MENTYCIIMAGGVGSRFWPMSTSKKPKQFLDILGVGSTLLQQTYERFESICLPQNIFIVTNIDYKTIIEEQLPQLNPTHILVEPLRRNTAPCLAYATNKIHKLNKNAVTIVAPSDHLILNQDAFKKAIKSCVIKAKEDNCLVTIGIKPTNPDTGYGYIQFVNSTAVEQDKNMYKVKTFTEKPTLEIAQQFIDSGDFLWNSGIFIWTTKGFLNALELYDEPLATRFKAGEKIYGTDKEAEFLTKAYTDSKNISIDYSLLEKANNVYVRSSVVGWSDLGTFGSLHAHIKQDKFQNALIGKNIVQYDCNNCLVNVPNEKLVVMQGLNDYIVVESKGVLLICKKQDEQLIRNFVNDVKVHKGEQFI